MSRPEGSRAQFFQRAALVAVAVVHLPYPLAFAWALLSGEEAGHSAGAAALLIAPVMFVITAAVVGPLAWRAWRGRRIAPWVLAAFVGLESWLYRNGTRTESWEQRGSAERLASFQLVSHTTVLVLLVGTTAAVLVSGSINPSPLAQRGTVLSGTRSE